MKLPAAKGQNVPADVIRAFTAVEVRQDECVSEEDRVVEEGLRGHEAKTDERCARGAFRNSAVATSVSGVCERARRRIFALRG